MSPPPRIGLLHAPAQARPLEFRKFASQILSVVRGERLDTARLQLRRGLRPHGIERPAPLAQAPPGMFSLVTDLNLLRQKVMEVGDVRMIQIDPISAYFGIGKIDSFRGTDVRAVLSPLIDLASDLKVAVLGIMHFNKKVDGFRAGSGGVV